MRPQPRLAVLLAFTALAALAGCGTKTSLSLPPPPQAPAPPTATAPATAPATAVKERRAERMSLTTTGKDGLQVESVLLATLRRASAPPATSIRAPR